MKEITLFTMFRRLRKCKRCGHFPCPCCVTWCDVINIHEEGEEEKECPCYADNCECWWTYDDVECNKEVLEIFEKLEDKFRKELEAEYGFNCAISFGIGSTEDGRLILSAHLMKRKAK